MALIIHGWAHNVNLDFPEIGRYNVVMDNTNTLNQNTNSKKFDPLLLVALVLAGLSAIAVVAITVVDTLRISSIEDSLNKQSATIASLQKQLNGNEDTKPINSNDIDVSFFDGYTPGSNYHLILDPVLNEVTVEVEAGCSLADESECDTKPYFYSAKLSEKDYDLFLDAYANINAASDDASATTRQDLLPLVDIVIALDMVGNESMGDPTYDDWEEIKVQDTDGDDIITGYEYASYMLNQLAKSTSTN